MARPTKEIIEIDEDASLTLQRQIARVEDSGGWINLTPGVPADVVAEPPRSLFTWLVGSAGPAAPLATWMPGGPGSQGSGQLGILHAQGRLTREGIAGLVSIPTSWRCLGDNARRGLVFEVAHPARVISRRTTVRRRRDQSWQSRRPVRVAID